MTKRASKAAPAPAADPPARGELWYYVPGGRPIAASDATRQEADRAAYFCRWGDRRWRPIGELAFNEEGATP